MVPAPVANAILQSATVQLQKNNNLFIGRTLVMDKFGEELIRQINQASTGQSQNLTAALSGARPLTFIPMSAETGIAACQKNSTSKRTEKKKRQENGSLTGLSPVSTKR